MQSRDKLTNSFPFEAIYEYVETSLRSQSFNTSNDLLLIKLNTTSLLIQSLILSVFHFPYLFLLQHILIDFFPI
jgi:hypothetical protein